MNPNQTDLFEQQLARALQRVPAPPALSAKLLALTAEPAASPEPAAPHVALRRARILAFPAAPSWLTGAIAALVVAGVFGGVEFHREHQRALAEQQFQAAIRVTDRALDHTREQLEKAGVLIGQ